MLLSEKFDKVLLEDERYAQFAEEDKKFICSCLADLAEERIASQHAHNGVMKLYDDAIKEAK